MKNRPYLTEKFAGSFDPELTIFVNRSDKNVYCVLIQAHDNCFSSNEARGLTVRYRTGLYCSPRVRQRLAAKLEAEFDFDNPVDSLIKILDGFFEPDEPYSFIVHLDNLREEWDIDAA